MNHIGAFSRGFLLQIVPPILTKKRSSQMLLLQDNVRNQLIQFELLLTTATFVVAIFGVVSGVFGMNFEVPLFSVPHAFEWTLAITGVCGAVVFCCFLWYFRKRRFFPL